MTFNNSPAIDAKPDSNCGRVQVVAQDVLGHESDKVSRQYAGEAREFTAADLIAKYGVAG